MNPREAAVADAGPIIHLDELAVLDVLECYERVHVPSKVADEADRHRPGWKNRGPSGVSIVTVDSRDILSLPSEIRMDLDPGEVETLAYWNMHRTVSVLCDDLKARETAKSMGAPVIGTVGLLVKAARQGRMQPAQVVSLIRSIPVRTTLHIARDLVENAASEIEKAFKVPPQR